MIKIKSIEENGLHLISLFGEVDAGSSVELDEAIGACVAAGGTRIIIDCSGLEYISSAGLGVFMSYVEEFQEKGIRMVLHSLQEKVAHTFRLLGLSDLLIIVANSAEAVQRIHEK